MNSKRLSIGSTEPIDATFLNPVGEPLVGLVTGDPYVVIQRGSDGYYYVRGDNVEAPDGEFIAGANLAGTEWKHNMVEVDSTLMPGKYRYTLYIYPLAFTGPDTYFVRATCTNTTTGNAPLEGEITTCYEDMGEMLSNMEHFEVITSATAIPARRVAPNLPSIIRKKLSDSFYCDIYLYYDQEGGQLIRGEPRIVQTGN